LDLDSTVFQRSGSQDGSAKGYNPRRPGRKSHHPILAVLAEVPLVLHGWLRSGNTGSARGVTAFLAEALALLPEGMWIRCVRADSGFFEDKEAVGRKLIDVPGYTFRVWVTNRSEGPLELWRDYNGRACVEQRIEELKNELGAEDFCTQNFWATEAAFLAVLFTFNLLSLYQHLATPKLGYRQPATLRTAVFVGGAILGRQGRSAVLHLSAAWGGLEKHKPLLEQILSWKNQTSPKLVPVEDQVSCAPCRI
jgi:hypothetical protein